jgi:hypothetical protein
MKKLRLDALKVDSFTTTDGIDAIRGTVAGYSAQCTIINCPVSYGGTCIISVCAGCDTDDC